MNEEKRSFGYIFGFKCEGVLHEVGLPVSYREKIKINLNLELWEQIPYYTVYFSLTIGKTCFQFEIQQETEIGRTGKYYVVDEIKWRIESRFSGRKRTLDKPFFFSQLWFLLCKETKFCDAKRELSNVDSFIRKALKNTIIL